MHVNVKSPTKLSVYYVEMSLNVIARRVSIIMKIVRNPWRNMPNWY